MYENFRNYLHYGAQWCKVTMGYDVVKYVLILGKIRKETELNY